MGAGAGLVTLEKVIAYQRMEGESLEKGGGHPPEMMRLKKREDGNGLDRVKTHRERERVEDVGQ